jgi:hypothetical protein
VGLAAAVVGLAAVLGAGYAVAGPSGLIDAAALAALSVLVVARATVRGQIPGTVRPKARSGEQAPAVRAADFPAYRKIASDLEWAQMSRRHYEYTTRPMLARLATALGRPQAAELRRPPAAGADGPGVDLDTLDRLITQLEGAP